MSDSDLLLSSPLSYIIEHPLKKTLSILFIY